MEIYPIMFWLIDYLLNIFPFENISLNKWRQHCWEGYKLDDNGL